MKRATPDLYMGRGSLRGVAQDSLARSGLAPRSETGEGGTDETSSVGRTDQVSAIDRHRVGAEGSSTCFPLTEFFETDEGRFAAPIPDPCRPGSIPSTVDDLPHRFVPLTVERSDQVFASIAEGPSLWVGGG